MGKKYCRILRGKADEDFKTLTDDPSRKYVFLFDEDGLNEIKNMDPLDELNEIKNMDAMDALIKLGWDSKYIENKVSEGYKFKLVIFEDEKDEVIIPTWDNLLAIIKVQYPDIVEYVARDLEKLKKFTFKEIELMGNFSFSEVDTNGIDDIKYMTYERYKNSNKTLIDTRAFLYFTMYLKELFSGDGYTYDNNNIRGIREYMMKNTELSKLNHQILDLDIKSNRKTR